jgi:DNA-binding transcriptional regulator YiaG
MTERRFSPGCSNCRRKEMALATFPYDITVAHDGRMHDVHIPNFVAPRCRNCNSISIDYVAEIAIESAFREQAHLLKAEEIESGRTALGLSQEQCADLLDVSCETVSWWENGHRRQRRCEDRMLRAFFKLPELRKFCEEEAHQATVRASLDRSRESIRRSEEPVSPQESNMHRIELAPPDSTISATREAV